MLYLLYMIKQTKLKIYILFLFVFSGIQLSFAAHIVGGEVTYECLGNGNYRFTMQIYRDCASGGAQFDSAGGGLPGTVSIFSGTTLFIETIELNPPVIENIPPNIDNPCLVIPDNICVERGTYTFTQSLPSSPEAYTITYQRCCRNGSITNIFLPGDTGATYTIELTPTAQTTCNNSPVFTNFPEIIICVGEPLDFDHSATDAEGDQLVYSLCSPVDGGGLAGTGGNGSFSDLNGVAPNPDAPPPYANVDFRAPGFTSQFPLGGEPRVTIDPITGVITGTPITRGQFVVGVCVEEFRNGQLLSTVRRDFQFNVEDCEPLVQADIVEDVFLGDKSFLVNVCGQLEFQFLNQSREQSNISDFFWEFDLDGDTTVFDVWEPLVMFPDTGQYMGTLVLNPGQPCGDTATIFVNVFPETIADFEAAFDTCVVGPVSFTDLSFTFADEIVSYEWDFGDGSFSFEQSPIHMYESPGLKEVVLTIEDNNGCIETSQVEFLWAPVPSEVIVQPTSFIACAPGGEVTFNNLTFPIDTTYDILWNFGDGGSSTEISPTHEFTDVGTFTVSVSITSPFDCTISETFNNFITIRQGPTADFSFAPDVITNSNPQVFFTDGSTPDVERWQWDFNGIGASQDQNPNFIFRDTGLQEIVLLVTAANGCVDTAFAFIDVIPIDSYHLPNAFTPNNDDRNDTYLGVGILENINDFNMKIWNRWGELMFETNDQTEGWNGRKNNTGLPLPAGVYVVLVNYESPRDGNIQLKAYATLIR